MSLEDGIIGEIVARKERVAIGIHDCKSGGNEFHISVQCTIHSPHIHPPIHTKAESCKTLQLKQWQILRC